jgi:hypothetical protein
MLLRQLKGDDDMQRHHQNRLAMFEAVYTYLKQNESAFAETQELEECMNRLKTMSNEIIELDDTRRNVSKGATSLKRETREAAVSAGNALAGALYAFAKKSKNITLADKINVTYSTLDNMRDIEFVLFLNAVRELANENMQSLASFGITPEKFNAYIQKFNDYFNALNMRESSRATRMSAARSLKAKFRETDELLKSLDKLIEAYRTENKQFFDGYAAVRNVHDLGSRHRKQPEISGNNPIPQS